MGMKYPFFLSLKLHSAFLRFSKYAGIRVDPSLDSVLTPPHQHECMKHKKPRKMPDKYPLPAMFACLYSCVKVVFPCLLKEFSFDG